MLCVQGPGKPFTQTATFTGAAERLYPAQGAEVRSGKWPDGEGEIPVQQAAVAGGGSGKDYRTLGTPPTPSQRGRKPP